MPADIFETDLMSLFTDDGERKYLNKVERRRFYKARKIIRDKCERNFVEFLFWTGARISEVLQLVVMRVNVEESFVILKTLKQNGRNKGRTFRIVHVPRKFMKRLNKAHHISSALSDPSSNQTRRLWTFGRQKGWRLVKRVMAYARIFGVKATPRGLRHSFGVNCILNNVPELRLQEWMGHTTLRTTAIYLKVAQEDDRAFARPTWKL